jgi:hypothetical protein
LYHNYAYLLSESVNLVFCLGFSTIGVTFFCSNKSSNNGSLPNLSISPAKYASKFPAGLCFVGPGPTPCDIPAVFGSAGFLVAEPKAIGFTALTPNGPDCASTISVDSPSSPPAKLFTNFQ